jgi:hypothetical protein
MLAWVQYERRLINTSYSEVHHTQTWLMRIMLLSAP